MKEDAAFIYWKRETTLNFESGARNTMTDWLSALYTLLAQIQAHANKQT